MSQLNKSPIWKSLIEHYKETKDVHMRDMFAEDSGRFEGQGCPSDKGKKGIAQRDSKSLR